MKNKNRFNKEYEKNIPVQSELFDRINKYVIDNISQMDRIAVNNIALHFGMSVGYISIFGWLYLISI